LGSYKRAFKELRGELPELDFYVFDDWKLEQILPWNHIQGPLPITTLKKHLAEAMALRASQKSEVRSNP
ncbi:MAG: radical SAM protein, partial [Okeania sp. SIO2D1]|nr:radical SAM protein [Okeania sp. SIO2D1]